MNKLLILLFMVIPSMAQVVSPMRYSLKSTIQDTFLIEGLQSNVVAEIRIVEVPYVTFVKDSILDTTYSDTTVYNYTTYYDSTYLTWFGTGQGLALHDGHNVYAFQTTSESMENASMTNILPTGGIPAIAVAGDTMMGVAFSGDDGTVQMGYGITITTDAQDTNGIEWKYYSQPVDENTDTLESILNQNDWKFRQLPVTVPQLNVTYDMSILGDYVYVTSWAGGLRRLDNNTGVWENIPLPLDDSTSLSLCEESAYDSTTHIVKDYYLNPRDPGDGGNHNHKAFSVLTYVDTTYGHVDTTIWVGTADGINRGILIHQSGVNGPSSCIEWEHYSYPDDGLSGNFVVGLARQMWNGQQTIWAATVNASDPGENRGLSYTRDDGTMWQTTLLGKRVYNVIAKDSLVLAATSSGLWKSLDGENWAKFPIAMDTMFMSQGQILTEKVYTASLDERDTIPRIWIGTSDGVALSSDMHGSNWTIFQAEFDSTEIYAYPNPFSPLSHNLLENDGYVRFHTGRVAEGKKIKLEIYNFAMEKVHATTFDFNTYQGAIKWNGRGQNDKRVSNGVYFAHLNFTRLNSSSPENFWTKFIVVK